MTNEHLRRRATARHHRSRPLPDIAHHGSPSTPAELDVHDALGRPFWEAAGWIWSLVVQKRLSETRRFRGHPQVTRIAADAGADR